MGEIPACGDDARPLTADVAVCLLRERISGSLLETWLTGSSGRRLAVVSNTEHAMVMLLDGEDDRRRGRPRRARRRPRGEGRRGATCS
ncbi:hypothetical protein [Streptomyces viridochromogenes]|uniref:hypothetical protein n=1 Tax=Streptomyces viridochromogenes TaxID=1938 RepID=UPI000B04E694|nr:hypothetical protein [Streptomyces viridochromogenes]